MLSILPIEIISKIQLYSHPILNRNIQKSIINYRFMSKNNKKVKICYECSRIHKLPRHFRC